MTASALPTFRLHAGAALPHALSLNHPPVSLESPALLVMTDLTQVRAATTRPETSLRQAEQLMIYQGVRMLFVVNTMPAVEGLITSLDLHGDKALTAGHERGLRYDDLRVVDVMIETAALEAIDFTAMASATVGHLVATLKRHGRHHLIVTESIDGSPVHRLRGVVSRSQIERQLGSVIEMTPIASSFSEIERALI